MHIKIEPLYFLISILIVLSAISQAVAAADSQPSDSTVQELDDLTLNDTLARYPFFILDVYKQLCNPCERMSTAISELSVELGDQAAFGTMEGRNNPLTEERYNVTGYPTLLVFKNGTLVSSSGGFASKKYTVDQLRLARPDLDTSRVTYE